MNIERRFYNVGDLVGVGDDNSESAEVIEVRLIQQIRVRYKAGHTSVFVDSIAYQPFQENEDSRRTRIIRQLTEYFRRRDTNNGKSYCFDCDANERKDGSIAHKKDCAVHVVLAAYDFK